MSIFSNIKQEANAAVVVADGRESDKFTRREECVLELLALDEMSAAKRPEVIRRNRKPFGITAKMKQADWQAIEPEVITWVQNLTGSKKKGEKVARILKPELTHIIVNIDKNEKSIRGKTAAERTTAIAAAKAVISAQNRIIKINSAYRVEEKKEKEG